MNTYFADHVIFSNLTDIGFSTQYFIFPIAECVQFMEIPISAIYQYWCHIIFSYKITNLEDIVEEINVHEVKIYIVVMETIFIFNFFTYCGRIISGNN